MVPEVRSEHEYRCLPGEEAWRVRRGAGAPDFHARCRGRAPESGVIFGGPTGDPSGPPQLISVAKNPQEEPFSEANLASPEYRERLMRKLNCLIAVLEVATAKVRKNMAGAPKDAERLARISANLQSTLEVCIRARIALQRRQAASPMPPRGSIPAQLPPAASAPPGARENGARRNGSDLSTRAEKRKFSQLPPIDPTAISSCDLDALAKRLLN